MGFIELITTQWPAMLQLLGLALLFGAGVAKFTATPKDDAFFAKVLNMFNMLPISAKATLDESEAKAKAAKG